MRKLTVVLLALSLPALAGQTNLHLSHPSTREKGPQPPVNYYYAVTDPVWHGPAHPATLDWGYQATRPHVVNDQVLDRKAHDHPPTRDWGPDRS